MQPKPAVWFLVGNGGMDYGDVYWGLYRDYYRDPFPHSLLSTRQILMSQFQFTVHAAEPFRIAAGTTTLLRQTHRL